MKHIKPKTIQQLPSKATSPLVNGVWDPYIAKSGLKSNGISM